MNSRSDMQISMKTEYLNIYVRSKHTKNIVTQLIFCKLQLMLKNNIYKEKTKSVSTQLPVIRFYF